MTIQQVQTARCPASEVLVFEGNNTDVGLWVDNAALEER